MSKKIELTCKYCDEIIKTDNTGKYIHILTNQERCCNDVASYRAIPKYQPIINGDGDIVGLYDPDEMGF